MLDRYTPEIDGVGTSGRGAGGAGFLWRRIRTTTMTSLWRALKGMADLANEHKIPPWFILGTLLILMGLYLADKHR